MGIEADRSLRVAVLGPGGVGGLMAALLARRGEHVICIARASTSDQLRKHGINVRSRRFGDFTTKVQAATTLRSAVDVCFVAVKATDLEPALARVPPDALSGGLVVPILNGIEHLTVLRELYGGRVVPATIRVETTRIAPGEIAHDSPFAFVELALGENDDALRSRSIRSLKDHLVAAGLDVETRSDEQAMLWGKLCSLAPLALLTTHENAPAGVIRDANRAELMVVIREIATVAGRAGVEVEQDAVLRFIDGVPETMRSSMQRDAAAGRSIEIEAIGGAILRAAEGYGVPVPLTAMLVAKLRRYQASVGQTAETNPRSDT